MGNSMDQIRDKDLAFAMLNDLKHTCDNISQTILETTNMQLRQSYLNILNETYHEQKQLFDMMQQRGWYKPMPAQQHEINHIYNSINTMQNDITQMMSTGSQQPQYYNQQQSTYSRNIPGQQQLY